ncbi:MAG TPA: amino acid adenylation domain-containing protein [Opitutaceae bacterium]
MTTNARANIEDLYELTPLQQGMVYHHLSEPAGGAYVEQTRFRIEGGLNVEAFVQAWQAVVDRQAALRSCFQWEGLARPMQIVLRSVSLPVERLDWSGLAPAQQAEELACWLEADRARGFDLTRAPLMRLTLMAVGEGAWQAVWSYSHLIVDGWCLPAVFRDVAANYESLVAGRTPERSPAPAYKAFILWLRRRDPQAAAAFWRQELAGFCEPTPLPVTFSALRTAPVDSGSVEARTVFTAAETARLQAWCRSRALTLNTLCQGAWAVLLGRMGGGSDVLFGSTVSGRPAELPGAEAMIGLFINTLPVRVRLPETVSATEWLTELQARAAAARAHEHTPLVEVQGCSEVPRGRSLFETLFVFENYPLGEAVAGLPAGLRVTEVAAYEKTHYTLTVVAAPGSELTVRFLGNGQRVDAGAAAYLAARYRVALESLVAGAEGPLGAVGLTTDAERAQLIAPAEPVEPIDWLDCFEQLAADRPERPALRFAGTDVSYGALADRAARVARRLQEAGAGPERVVALCLDRSLDLPTAMLAVLRSGAAYLPLDPAYPQARLDFMLADSGATLLLVHREHAARFAGSSVRLLVWEDLAASATSAQPASARPGGLDNLAYVIYTSGSTGRPKGVMVSRAAWATLAAFQRGTVGVGPEDRVLQFAAASFDASVWELSLALGTGAQLVLAPRESLLPGAPLAAVLRDERISCVLLPPSGAALLPEEGFPDLRLLITGGEACRPESIARWAPGRRFVNAYGPTENAVVSTWAELASDATAAPIGRPVTGTTAYVLDDAGRLVPPGAAGELCVSGPGLARGYLGRPELTAERFQPDPFSDRPGARIYRTGDRVWRDEAGRLHYLGRIDAQIKLRGQRIELGEIEAALTAQPGVAAAVVDLRPVQGEPTLVAYVVPAAGATVSTEELREGVRRELTAAMVPAVWVLQPALPLMPNGKIDRRALPDPAVAAGEPGRGVAPATPLEETIAGIWRKVLSREHVGVTDNFFDLGGHSLRLVTVQSSLQSALVRPVTITDLFTHPTVRALATHLGAAADASAQAPASASTPAVAGSGLTPAERAARQRAAQARRRPGAGGAE